MPGQGRLSRPDRVACRDELEAVRQRQAEDERTASLWKPQPTPGRSSTSCGPSSPQIVVGNPLKTKAIAEAKIKTDKVDAEVLAQLLRCDYLPAVWQPDDRDAAAAQPGHAPHGLMTPASSDQEPDPVPAGRLLIQSALQGPVDQGGNGLVASHLDLPAHERLVLDSELRQLDAIDAEQELLDTGSSSWSPSAREKPRVQLLMTHPGRQLRRGAGPAGGAGRHHPLPRRRSRRLLSGLGPVDAAVGQSLLSRATSPRRAVARSRGC